MIHKILFLLLLPVFIFAWRMESGTFTIQKTGKNGWQTVSLQQTYKTTPIIFTMPTSRGSDPANIRIKNVTKTQFDITITEPPNEDGPHTDMNIAYIAIEPGLHYLTDGTKLIVSTINTTTQQAHNTVDTDTGWETIEFNGEFEQTPVILSMIQTTNNEINDTPNEPSSPYLTVAIDNVSKNSFKIALERSEVNEGNVTEDETIGYMVIENNKKGKLDINNTAYILYETAMIDGVKGWDNDGCYEYNFMYDYDNAPNVVSTKQTRKGDNGGWLRECFLDENKIGVEVDEDRYNDNERNHIEENASFVVFEKNFIFDSSKLKPILEYRLDDCLWQGIGSFDVEEEITSNNAESYNNAEINTTDAIINFSGNFHDIGYINPRNTIPLNSTWSYALWVKFPLDNTNHSTISIDSTGLGVMGMGIISTKYYYHTTGSVEGDGDLPAILDEKDGDELKWGVYDNDQDLSTADLPNDLADGWHHFVFVQDDDMIHLYLDGEYNSNVSTTLNGDIEVLLTSTDEEDNQTIGSSVDEIKLWNFTLSIDDINRTYQNESKALNYDNSQRTNIICNASIDAYSWELIGIPADLRNEDEPSIENILADDMSGDYGDDWRIYKRVYSDTNNSGWYVYLDDISTNLELGVGYWLGSKKSSTWDVNDMLNVDYNSTNEACESKCIEIPIKSISKDFNQTENDGTGAFRYFLTGFMGKKSINWSDCRFIIDGEVFTPSQAQAKGYISNQVWFYNSDGNDYTTCNDTVPGNCKLIPYKGFWIELDGPSQDKNIKLMIPKD